MIKKILFITTSSLSTNPRLLKSYLALSNGQYECEIICFKLGNWSDDVDDKLISEYSINCHRINAGKSNIVYWMFVGLIYKLLNLLQLKYNTRFLSYFLYKRSIQIDLFLKFNKVKADFIIAHNLGAAYSAFYLARKQKVNFAFDIEDYHPGEIVDYNQISTTNDREVLMKKILPKAKFLTAASHFIAKRTKKLLENENEITIINNSFYESEFTKPNKKQNSKVRFVWFSQTISPQRGLELFFNALNELSQYRDSYEVTLIGEIDKNFYHNFLSKINVKFTILPPIEQKKLHSSLANYDIGLALELSSVDLNKDLALSNKIFAYSQAGLYILATDTKGQEHFINKNVELGTLSSQNEVGIKLKLIEIFNNIEMIREGKQNRYRVAKKISFDNEIRKLLKLIDEK